MKDWSLQDAKNRFSAVVDAALSGAPQRVTRRGKPAVVVLAVDEYERLRRNGQATAPTFIDLLLDMPQGGEAKELWVRIVEIAGRSTLVAYRPYAFGGERMTVRELIDLLQQHPAGLRVVVNGYEEGYDDLSPQQISTAEIALNTGKHT